MKHTLSVTFAIFLLFVSSQIVGLWILKENTVVTGVIDPETGYMQIEQQDQWERPAVSGWGSVLYIAGAIVFGTVLILLVIKFRKRILWKAWLFLAVWLTITLSLGVFLSPTVAFAVGATLAFLKFFRPNVVVHNLTEVFLYSGIAVLLVPILELVWVVVLLLIISIYDFYAVFKSKHMVEMAKFQSTVNVFAGLSIPYSMKDGTPKIVPLKPPESEEEPEFLAAKKPKKAKSARKRSKEIGQEFKTAILGGGDIAFPMIFAGVLMQELVQKHAISLGVAFASSLGVSLCAAGALLGLLSLGRKDTFYPAMPFLTAGCLVGTVAVYLINLSTLPFI